MVTGPAREFEIGVPTLAVVGAVGAFLFIFVEISLDNAAVGSRDARDAIGVFADQRVNRRGVDPCWDRPKPVGVGRPGNVLAGVTRPPVGSLDRQVVLCVRAGTPPLLHVDAVGVPRRRDDIVAAAAERQDRHTLGECPRVAGVDTFVTVEFVRGHGFSLRDPGSGVGAPGRFLVTPRPEEPVCLYLYIQRQR